MVRIVFYFVRRKNDIFSRPKIKDTNIKDIFVDLRREFALAQSKITFVLIP